MRKATGFVFGLFILVFIGLMGMAGTASACPSDGHGAMGADRDMGRDLRIDGQSNVEREILAMGSGAVDESKDMDQGQDQDRDRPMDAGDREPFVLLLADVDIDFDRDEGVAEDLGEDLDEGVDELGDAVED